MLVLNTNVSGTDNFTGFEFNNSSNSLAGTVRLNRGRIILDNAAALGSASLFAQTVASSTVGSGNVELNGSYTLANNITTNTTNDSFDVPGTNLVMLSGVFTSPVLWVKQNTGTLTLANASDTFLGVTINGGTLSLNTTSTIAATGALTLSNGTLQVAPGSGVTFGSTTIGVGSSLVNNAGTNPVALKAITRNVGGVVDFGSTTSGGGVSTSTANVIGILGGYATTDGGTYFAAQTSSAVWVTKYTSASQSSMLANGGRLFQCERRREQQSNPERRCDAEQPPVSSPAVEPSRWAEPRRCRRAGSS